MHHIQFCLDEILAEIDAHLEEARLVSSSIQSELSPLETDTGRVDRQALKQVHRRIVETKSLVAAAFGVHVSLPTASDIDPYAYDGGASRSIELDMVMPSQPVVSKPVVVATPRFKSMQERLAAAVGEGEQAHTQPVRA